MNLKVYEKTRYQNIYRHIKNKNYVVSISKPVKTSISMIDGKKIYRVEEAIDVRDNKKIRTQKGKEITCKDDFDNLWNKYVFYCKYDKKLAYNTISKKEKMYKKFIAGAIVKKVTKITKEDIMLFFSQLNCSNKQKNELIRQLKAFFNWCVKEEYLIASPVKLEQYKVEKSEMKFWTPDEIKKILGTLDSDIVSDDYNDVKRAMLVKTLIILDFSLGDRVGETRALRFCDFDDKLNIVHIKHSINYDPKSDDFVSFTKNYQSQRVVDISPKVIEIVKEYKQFLMDCTDYDVKDDDLIFFNYMTKRPLSDSSLREKFNYYIDKAGVKKIRMYDLRHTYVATLMSEGKELYQISTRLGHSNYYTTVNKYGHLSHQIKREIAEVTDKYI